MRDAGQSSETVSCFHSMNSLLQATINTEGPAATLATNASQGCITTTARMWFFSGREEWFCRGNGVRAGYFDLREMLELLAQTSFQKLFESL